MKLNLFIGYDSKEPAAYAVACHSVMARASAPITITPLALRHLGHVYTRERNPMESTEFSMTRFLVPYLSGYSGYSIFMDCDMLVRCDLMDVVKMFFAMPQQVAVACCQHDYVPKTDTKFLGQIQTKYPRKNWSSFMVFDNALCRSLTPAYVNSASGLELHRMMWTSDASIGALPLDLNWLVGEYPTNNDARILHYTLGGPWFHAYRDTDHAQDWYDERDAMLADARLGLTAAVA